MKTFALTVAAMAGFTLLGTASASAGGIYFSTGSQGHGYGGSYYGSHNGVWGRRPASRGHYHYHDTSHFDYVPAHVVPHGNHLHYIPAQRYFHRDGHYDYHRGGHRHHHH